MSRRRPAPRRQNFFGRFVSFLVLVVVLFAACFGIFWLLGDTLFPLKIDQNIVFVNSNLDGEVSTIVVANFTVDEQRLSVVPLDGKQEVNVLGGYGKYQLTKVYPLLKIDKKNDQQLKAALSWSTGVVIDEVIAVDDQLSDMNQEKITKLLQNQIFRQGFHLNHARKLATLYFFAKAVPPEQVTVKPVLGVLDELPGKLNQSSHQECSIAIINTTATPKLASRLSALIENTAMRVVRVDDTTTSSDDSLVTFDLTNLVCQEAANRIGAVFPDELAQVDKPELRHEHRADLVIIVGNDLGKLLVP